MIPAQFTGIPAVLHTIPRNVSKIRIIKTISHLESWNIQNPGMNTKRIQNLTSALFAKCLNAIF